MIFTARTKAKPTKKQVQRTIERFMKTGESGLHSPMGMLLAPLLNHCQDNDIPFTLFRGKGGFYYLKKGVPEDETTLS